MKIKLFDRIIMALISVVLTAAGMIMFLVPFMYDEANTAPMKYILMAGGVLVFLSGAAVWMLVCKYYEHKKDYIIQQNECGPMRISVKAVEDLVQKCVDTHEEVKEDKIRIVNGRDGVRVDLAVSLPNNISIPLAVDTLQKHVKNYLKASSGIEVTGVRISVNTTKGEIATEGALDVHSQEAAESVAPAPKQEPNRRTVKTIKKPAHQLIFGRSKQEIEEDTREGVEAVEEAAAEAEEAAETMAEEAQEAAAETAQTAEETAEQVITETEAAAEEAQDVPAAEEDETEAEDKVIGEN